MKCIKSLYKSTYKKNAFSKNRNYTVVSEDDEFFFLKDNNGNPFNLAKTNANPTYYFIEDYFDLSTHKIKKSK